ncbi:MAG: ABC-F family ATP-binding cassette domain-containing protein [Rickettsiaceae bacterium]|nr:ABC-F family ATP-binding cassette domain-containing protein [Rickettsiaceae bacterium]
MTTPIFYIKSGSLSFADKFIFDELELYLYPNDKICFVGKNGAGKSSLLKIITGEYHLDQGEIYKDPSVKISYLRQEATLSSESKIIDYLTNQIGSNENLYELEIILAKLSLDPNAIINQLSGGMKRRIMLATSLYNAPDVLLLDEPTNHLDINSITWLEEFIQNFPGAVVLISHDRRFLSNITNKIWWLDRGYLRKSNEGFKNFEQWQENIIEFEENQLRKLDKKLDNENLWLAQGVTARRKRNQKRLASLKTLRQQMQSFKSNLASSKAKLSMDIEKDIIKSRFILEVENLCFAYKDKNIINNFSIRITKGEKIGIIGPNGSGKSTLLKLLMKEISPTSGSIKYAHNLIVTYMDQQRLELCNHQSIASFLCPTGTDTVFLKDKEMHIAGYLKKFLFDPKIKDAKISTLSGGEKNRLLLAKSLISPGNFMILDEPTNDLDADTLDLLLEILADYEGTLIVVSHDRDFLDKLVIKSLIFTENNIEEIIGGFAEYENILLYKNAASPKARQTKTNPQKDTIIQIVDKPKKLTYKDSRLLDTLPITIEFLETEIESIEKKLENPKLFLDEPKKFYQLTSHLEQKKEEWESALKQWLEVAEKYKNI